jgi:hypothetical protein
MPFMAITETFQLAQRVEEVDRRARPSRKFGHKDDIDLSGLGQGHDLAAFGSI